MDYASFPIAFTQTVDQQFYLCKHPSYRKQYTDSLNYLKATLGGSVEAIIFPELTLNGCIHYHGFLRVIDAAAYAKARWVLKKNLGFNYFKYIDDVEKWVQYCNKDVTVMQQLLHASLPVIHVQTINL